MAATTATQAAIVLIAPLNVAIGRDLHASVSAIGQSRSVLAGAAVLTAGLFVGPLIERLGVRPLLLAGGALALLGQAGAAASPSLGAFYAANAVVGLGVACLLSAGFAGVGAWFDQDEAPRALAYVVGAQSVAWIAGNPLIGVLEDAFSWREAYLVPASAALIAIAAGLAAPRAERRPDELDPRDGLLSVLRDRSARRWAVAELVAYSAWTAELTYIGAFYIRNYGIEESSVGLLMAVGSVFFLVGTLLTDRAIQRLGRRPATMIGAVGMGTVLVPLMNLTPSVWFTLALFCPMALFAALRTTSSSALGLDQMPGQPGSMMAARTVSAQLGYMVGAAWGGVVLSVTGFGTLGFVLLAGMALSAVLVRRVDDPVTVAVDGAHRG